MKTLMGFLFTVACLAPMSYASIDPTSVIDQQQLLYDGGMSARTLSGYSVTQTFTAGISGTLTEIDMGFFAGSYYEDPNHTVIGYDTWSGVGELSIRGGIPGQNETVSVFTSAQPLTWNDWQVNVSVVSGQKYSFTFTPGLGIPDPYGVAIGASMDGNGAVLPQGPYVNGALDGDSRFDAVFRTLVDPSDPAQSVATLPEPHSFILFAGVALALVPIVRKRYAKPAEDSRTTTSA